MRVSAETSSLLRIGVAGAGYWAAQVHIPVLCDHPGVAMVGLWNRDAEKARAVAASSGVAAFATYDDMLAQVDVVSFAIPPDTQAKLATRAAAAGKHLLLEKPLALSLIDGEALVAAIASSRVASVVFYTRRFVPEVEQAVADIAAERRWQRASGHFLAGALLPGTPYSGSAWRHQRGALWDLGPHVLSLLTPILGDVAAVAATQDAAKATNLRLAHAGGGQSEVTMSLHAPPADHGEAYTFHDGTAEARLTMTPAPRLAAYGRAVDALLASISTGTPHALDAAFGLRTLRVLVAAETSLAHGGDAVSID